MGQIRQIGANIRFYREKKGLTQRELADSLIVSFQAISAWERGISVPDLENAVRIANFFGITVDALLAGATQEPSLLITMLQKKHHHYLYRICYN